MRLKNDQELKNTKRKLSGLLEVIEQDERTPNDLPGRELSLRSLRRFAEKLRLEIEEYEQAHQPSESK
jgi:hypothetical protein